MAKVSLAFRIESERKETLQSRAEEMGMSLADFLRDGAELLGDFDLVFWKRVDQLSKTLNIDPAKVIQNIVIDRFAAWDAESEANNNYKNTFDMFVFNEKGNVTGQPLYSSRKIHYLNQKINKTKTLIEAMTGHIDRNRRLIDKNLLPEMRESIMSKIETAQQRIFNLQKMLIKTEAALAKIDKTHMGFEGGEI